jgi:protein regulator of cytokinesis 1
MESDDLTIGSRNIRYDSDLVTRNNSYKSPTTPSTAALRTSSLTTSTHSRLTHSTRGSTPLAAATIQRQQQQRSMLMARSSNSLGQANQQLQDSVFELLSSTVRQLEEIWDTVGCSTEERTSQLQQMYSKINSVCSDTIQEELLVAEQFKKSIHEAREEFKRLCNALNIDEYNEYDGNDACLEEELTALETKLEKLRITAKNATEQLQTIRDELIYYHQALNGADPPEETWWLDVASDLTESRCERFHKELADMKDLIQSRSVEAVQLLCECQHLLRDLKLMDNTVGEESSTTSEFPSSGLDLKIMTSLSRASTTSSSLSTEKVTYSSENLVSKLSTPFSKKASDYQIQSIIETETCTGISSVILEQLTNRLSELNGEKRRRKQRLGELGSEIAFLWERLHVSEEDQEAFRATVQGIGLDTIRKGEQELERLHALKDGMMGKLIKDARFTIEKLWAETSTSEVKRRAFKAFYVKEEEGIPFSDELLLQHEEYIQELESRLELMLPLLKLIAKREEIISERMQYENFQKDPDRLQQRGAALTKQLMMEEKMAKRIKKDLPKLTEMLEKKCREWKLEQGEPLLYKGVPYSDTMKKQEEEWRDYKDEEANDKLRRKQEASAAAASCSENAMRSGTTTSYTSIQAKKKTASSNDITTNTALASNRHPSRGRTGLASRPLPNAPSSRENIIRGTAEVRHPSQGRVRPTTK